MVERRKITWTEIWEVIGPILLVVFVLGVVILLAE